MTGKYYKYKLHSLLRKLTVEDYEIALSHLPQWIGVSKDTFRAWIYIKDNEPREIHGTALIKLANFFQIQPFELFTHKPKFFDFEEYKLIINKKMVCSK